jgi:hypothetical protein
VRNGFHFDETLAKEIFHVGSHAIIVAAIDKFREILSGHSAEFPELHHRCDFRVPEAIGSAAKFMDGAGFTGAACRAPGLATWWARCIFPGLLTGLVGFAWISGVGLPGFRRCP